MERLSPDLGYAILTATIVEEQLELLLLTHLRLNDQAAKLLFGGRGCYESFSRKIELAKKEELIGEETRSDLDVMGRIRNEFAHTRERLHFSSPSIKALAEKFSNTSKNANVRLLFDDRVEHVVNAVRERMDQKMWEDANGD